VLGDGVDLVIKPPAAALEQMNEVVIRMHTSSGLLEELDAGLTMREAEEQVLAYVREQVPEARKAPLAGNTIGTDRMFLARDMPELENWMHYRVIDVSSIKELTRQWYPRAYFAAPSKAGNHRALADITESIDELRYYRKAVFVAPPGPDTEAARALAAEVLGTADEEPEGPS
jgi:oligoribonuclease